MLIVSFLPLSFFPPFPLSLLTPSQGNAAAKEKLLGLMYPAGETDSSPLFAAIRQSMLACSEVTGVHSRYALKGFCGNLKNFSFISCLFVRFRAFPRVFSSFSLHFFLYLDFLPLLI